MSDAKPMNTVIFRASDTLIAALDGMAGELRMSRSLLIREAVSQRIAFYEKHERETVRALQRQTDAFYGPSNSTESR